jgi:hypothetical protein
MTGSVLKGAVAGFAATVVVSLFILAKEAAGWWPQLDFVRVLSGAGDDAVGWTVHFAVGTLVLGPLFAILAPRIPGTSCIGKAIVFACAAWLFMQLVVMPMVGVGVFGARYGFVVPTATFAMNVIFGVVLGLVFELQKGAYRSHHHHVPGRYA